MTDQISDLHLRDRAGIYGYGLSVGISAIHVQNTTHFVILELCFPKVRSKGETNYFVLALRNDFAVLAYDFGTLLVFIFEIQ